MFLQSNNHTLKSKDKSTHVHEHILKVTSYMSPTSTVFNTVESVRLPVIQKTEYVQSIFILKSIRVGISATASRPHASAIN